MGSGSEGMGYIRREERKEGKNGNKTRMKGVWVRKEKDLNGKNRRMEEDR